MLQLLAPQSKQVETLASLNELKLGYIWYDLFNPSSEEIKAVEKLFNLILPTREAMQEIEPSSRLHVDEEIFYMTSLLIANAESDNPLSAPVSFILTPQALITLRYIDPKPFSLVFRRIAKREFSNSDFLFLELIDCIVDRIADILELNASDIDLLSKKTFRKERMHNANFMHNIVLNIGKTGNMNTNLRESLESFDRQLTFYSNQKGEEDPKILQRITTLQRDVRALIDHVSFLFHKIDFLLEATLGFINIEQNAIIKIFSVAAVIFLPPTLIASVYGMNFDLIPELKWLFGYPFALFLMILSAVIPLFYFKKKKWL